MNKWILLFAIITALNLPGCSMFDTKKDIAVTPTLATAPAPAIDDVVLVEEKRELRPAVPRVKQAQVIGVVRELVRSGCVVEKVATTDGIHYSQLIVNCGKPQAAPAIQ
jgi:hypothetical protein